MTRVVETTPSHVIIQGYKATNLNMTCRGHQFTLGVWYENEGEPIACLNGFHFCEHLTGPYHYYTDEHVRLFKVEAKEVSLVESLEDTGAIVKRVARWIRLVEEITPGHRPENDENADKHNCGLGNVGMFNKGDHNTGSHNTGNANSGHRNIGNGNGGDRNAGDFNTGNCNTGALNSGIKNFGNSNTGSENTGSRNTGSCNSGSYNSGSHNRGRANVGDSNIGDANVGTGNQGYFNTGDNNHGSRNSGYRNRGESNTGHGNIGNYNSGRYNIGNGNTGSGNIGAGHTGYFNCQPVTVRMFDQDTGLTIDDFEKRYGYMVRRLNEALMLKNEPVDFEFYKALPGITLEKLEALHEQFIAAREKLGLCSPKT